MPAPLPTTKLLAAASAIMALASTPVCASDIGPRPSPPPSYGWRGPYVGGTLGYQWGDVSHSGSNPSGVAGGALAGYNWQFGQFVFGGETDLQGSDADDTFASWKFSNPWFGTLRARGGFAMNNVMFYGTLGLAYGTLRAQSALSGLGESHLTAGWAGGGGLEVGLLGNWTARAEYLYVNLDKRNFVLDGTTHGIASNLLRLGINYRF